MQETAIFIMFVLNTIFKIYLSIKVLINNQFETGVLKALRVNF